MPFTRLFRVQLNFSLLCGQNVRHTVVLFVEREGFYSAYKLDLRSMRRCLKLVKNSEKISNKIFSDSGIRSEGNCGSTDKIDNTVSQLFNFWSLFKL